MAEMQLDPLYVIFEQHLYDFNDDTDTESAFIDKVVGDYIKFLHINGSIVPPRLQKQISEELKDQVQNMLRKKIYGCINRTEFVDRQKAAEKTKRRSRTRFALVKKAG